MKLTTNPISKIEDYKKQVIKVARGREKSNIQMFSRSVGIVIKYSRVSKLAIDEMDIVSLKKKNLGCHFICFTTVKLAPSLFTVCTTFASGKLIRSWLYRVIIITYTDSVVLSISSKLINPW